MRKIQIIVVLTLTVTTLSLLTALAWAAPPLHHASGGGFFTAQGGSGDNEFMFAFNASQLNNDHGENAQGQFEQHNITNGNILHMKITEMDVFGKTVWLKGEVTKSIGANAGIGACREVKLQDNGEGKNADLDMRSKLSSKCDGTGLVLIDLDYGNIQIR